jgi:mono/diheme cytochrome c family protein
MRLLPFLFVILTFFSYAEDFITEFEYGQMLYRDPHGASCAACHGEAGEGKLISEYADKQGKYVSLVGPDIRNATLARIRASVESGKGVMPRYFLTDKEIKTIYAYLQKVNNHKKTAISKLFSDSDTDN